MVDFTDAGVLTTASDLLFSGGPRGAILRAQRPHRGAAVAIPRRRPGAKSGRSVILSAGVIRGDDAGNAPVCIRIEAIRNAGKRDSRRSGVSGVVGLATPDARRRAYRSSMPSAAADVGAVGSLLQSGERT